MKLSRNLLNLLTTALFVALISMLMISLVPISTGAVGAVEATIWTDKQDYLPGDTVTISGTGFAPDSNINVRVTRPDSTVGSWSVASNGAGDFTTTYLLDGITGTYIVTATDGTNTATTTFNDAVRIVAGYTTGFAQGQYGTAPPVKDTFYTTDHVNAVIGTGSGSGSNTVHLYVLDHSPSDGEGLVGKDVSGGYETVTVDESHPYFVYTVWPNPTVGTYYFVLDGGNDRYGGDDFSNLFTVTTPTVSITITSSPAGSGFVKVGGIAITTPTTFTWTIGDTHTLKALSPVPDLIDPTGTQYVWTSWSDTGDQTHDYTVPSAPETVTASYKTQFKVSFAQLGSGATVTVGYSLDNGTFGSKDVPFWFWVDKDLTITYAYPEIIPGAAGVQYVLTGVSPASSQKVTAPLPIAGSYKTQYLLTVKTNGLPVPYSTGVHLAGSSTPTTDDFGVSSINDGATNGWRKWFDASPSGTGSIGVESPVSGPANTRYAFKDWSDATTTNPHATLALTGPFTLVVNYKTQFWIQVDSAHDVPTASAWVDLGNDFTASVTSPTPDNGTGTRFSCTGYKIDSGSLTLGATYKFTSVGAPHTIEFDWIRQYYLTVNTNPVGLDTPLGEDWYDAGATAHVSAAQYASIVPGDSRYRFDSWSGAVGTYADATIVMSSAKTATANYVTQFYLTVTSAHGTTGGEGWYDENTNAYATLAAGTDPTVPDGSGVQYVFTGWSGGASGAGLTSDPIYMDGPKTAVANWDTYYLVTYAANVPVTVPDDEWVLSGHAATGVFPSPVISDGTKYVFVSDNRPDTITAPTTVTATYDTYYRVTVNWSGLAADASGKVVTITVGGVPILKNAGGGFYDDWLKGGTTVSYSFEPKVGSSIANKAYKLIGVAGTSTGVSHNFGAISGPVSETGNYGSIILAITKKAPSAVFAGDTIRYIYEVKNTGTTSSTGITVTDGSLTVVFVGGDVNGNGALDPKETWVYTATYGPASGSSITNTAVLSCDEGATAQGTAEVSVYELQVTKTAQTSFKRTYTWTISKTADPACLTIQSGTETVDYDIKLEATFIDSNWKVTGTITIYNPAPIDAVITGVTDVVSLNIPATINLGPVTFPYTLGAGQTLTLTYSADLPDASARSNTATVTMQNYERPFLWDLTGDWVIRVYYGGNYDHDMTLTMDSNGQAFTGTGGYPAGGPYSITETVTGVTAVSDVFWHSVYNNGYFWDAVGTIAADRKMSGTWTSSAAQSGSWQSISGGASLVKTGTGTSTLTGSADVDFSGATMTEVDQSVTVTDTYSGGPQSQIVNYAQAPQHFTYTRDIGPYANIGIYTVENTASFVASTTGTTGHADCAVTVYRIGSAVTDSSFYLFDFDSANGRQFKLIFTPDVPDNPSGYKLTASNPGQFYYNILYYTALPTELTFTITPPYLFVTQGAMPVHVYSSLTAGLIPGTDVTSQFDIEWSADGKTVTVTSKGAYSGFVYITVHLDYRLKGSRGYTKTLNDATGTTTPVNDLTTYTFSVAGALEDSDAVENKNVFKHDPGFGGLVTDSQGNPVKGVKVQIYGPDGKLIATVYTDEDGWYMYNYKWTGKAATFTVKLPDYKQSKSVTLKANGFVVVNFVIP
jgi:hypothetical protein